jgi:hypothetical protein
MNKYLRDLKKAISNPNLIYKNLILQFSKTKIRSLTFHNNFHLKKNNFQKLKNKKLPFKIDLFQMEDINKKALKIKLNQ